MAMMQIILTKDVDNLGRAGDLVRVKPGYGRNYLLPQGLAYTASDDNIRRLEEEQAAAEERSRRDYLEARRRASQLEGLSLTFTERADGEQLYGSVTAADVVAKANEGGLDFELDKKAVLLEEPIKTVGPVTVPVRLHAEVEASIEVVVEAEEG